MLRMSFLDFVRLELQTAFKCVGVHFVVGYNARQIATQIIMCTVVSTKLLIWDHTLCIPFRDIYVDTGVPESCDMSYPG